MKMTVLERIRLCAMLVLLPSLALLQSGCAAKAKSENVYVCACLKTKSCSCMTEAKTPGPCACGTQGGPPLKAVRKDSAWAKANRDALGN